MSEWIFEADIIRYQRQLREETEPRKREKIERLLEATRQRRKASQAGHRGRPMARRD